MRSDKKRPNTNHRTQLYLKFAERAWDEHNYSCNTAIAGRLPPCPCVYVVKYVVSFFNQQLAPLFMLYATGMSSPMAIPLHSAKPCTESHVLHTSIHCCSEYALMLVVSPSLMLLSPVQLFLLLSQATNNGGQLVSMRMTEAAVEGMYTAGVEPPAEAVFVGVTAFVDVADIVGVAGAWVNVQVGLIHVAVL
jgi:hypothetical protein